MKIPLKYCYNTNNNLIGGSNNNFIVNYTNHLEIIKDDFKNYSLYTFHYIPYNSLYSENAIQVGLIKPFSDENNMTLNDFGIKCYDNKTYFDILNIIFKYFNLNYNTLEEQVNFLTTFIPNNPNIHIIHLCYGQYDLIKWSNISETTLCDSNDDLYYETVIYGVIINKIKDLWFKYINKYIYDDELKYRDNLNNNFKNIFNIIFRLKTNNYINFNIYTFDENIFNICDKVLNDIDQRYDLNKEFFFFYIDLFNNLDEVRITYKNDIIFELVDENLIDSSLLREYKISDNKFNNLIKDNIYYENNVPFMRYQLLGFIKT